MYTVNISHCNWYNVRENSRFGLPHGKGILSTTQVLTLGWHPHQPSSKLHLRPQFWSSFLAPMCSGCCLHGLSRPVASKSCICHFSEHVLYSIWAWQTQLTSSLWEQIVHFGAAKTLQLQSMNSTNLILANKCWPFEGLWLELRMAEHNPAFS